MFVSIWLCAVLIRLGNYVQLSVQFKTRKLSDSTINSQLHLLLFYHKKSRISGNYHQSYVINEDYKINRIVYDVKLLMSPFK